MHGQRSLEKRHCPLAVNRCDGFRQLSEITLDLFATACSVQNFNALVDKVICDRLLTNFTEWLKQLCHTVNTATRISDRSRIGHPLSQQNPFLVSGQFGGHQNVVNDRNNSIVGVVQLFKQRHAVFEIVSDLFGNACRSDSIAKRFRNCQ